MKLNIWTGAIVAIAMTFSMVGCGMDTVTTTTEESSLDVSSEDVTSTGEEIVLRYAMWDSNQQPAYEQIMDNFESENPGVTVQIEVIPWADYWTKLTTQASGGDMPDVMNMYLVNFMTLQSKGVLADLTSYIEADGLDLSKYNEVALDAFNVDGAQYGLPKDFDSYAVFYNEELLAEAGYDSYPEDLSWNVEDGGTYVKFLQDLTLDSQGLHPYDEGFDKDSIVQYGLLPIDRTEYLADGVVITVIAQNGGSMVNEEGNGFALSTPEASEALEYLWKLTNEWYVCPSSSIISSTGPEAIFYSQTAATWYNGPWMTSAVDENTTFDFGISLIPAGPTGESVSRVNSLIDCVYEGSENKDMAWELVKYIATEGQEVLGSTGTVIPAHSDYTDTYVAYYNEMGLDDVQTFVDAYNGEVLFPISLNELTRADDIVQRYMTLAMDGTGNVSMADTIEAIESECNEFLAEAN